jgi:putative DNA primase/helicase
MDRQTFAVNPRLPVSLRRKKLRETHKFMRTDAGNAELFASQNADELRYDHVRRCWFRWNGHIWMRDKDLYIMRRAKGVARCRMENALGLPESDDRAKEIKWALSSEGTYRLKALLEQAKATEPLTDSGEDWDSDPYLLAVKNGVIDLRKGTLRAGRPEDRITLQSQVPFDPSATCPRWEQFLHEILGGDEEVIRFVQRALGYCLTGATTEQCLFLCYGDGSNGKSTFLNVIAYILGLGEYAHNLPFSAFEIKSRSAIPNDVAALVGKRFVTAVETGEAQRLNEARVKALTGSDPVTARFLFADYFTFQPVAKFWLAFNHKPVVEDDSYGFWRRIRLIPFTQIFEESRKDKQLEAKLREEAPGILAWMVRGCLEWQEKGLGLPRAVEEATLEYRSESDLLNEFIEECCVLASELCVSSASLWDEYEKWARGQGQSSLQRRAFAGRVQRLNGVKLGRLGAAGTRGWRGIGLKKDIPLTWKVGDLCD